MEFILNFFYYTERLYLLSTSIVCAPIDLLLDFLCPLRFLARGCKVVRYGKCPRLGDRLVA